MLIPEPRTPLKKLSIDANESEVTEFSIYHDDDEYKKQKIILRFKNSFREVLTGIFPKKTMNMTWTERYFCLTETRLIYYANEKKEQLKGCFNLVSLAQYDLRVEATYPIVSLAISVPTGKHVHQKQLIKLCIEDRKVFHTWRDTLSKLINSQKQNLRLQYPLIGLQSITSPKNKENFWNKITISQKQFLSYANHLDILLFRSKSEFLPTFQRFFMRSYYDHVGIVVKDQIDRVFILEATESRGVWISPWSQMLAAYRSIYEEIGYRKLVMKSTGRIDEGKLQSLLNNMIGKKYELSFKKLLCDSKSEICPQEQKIHPKFPTKETTYFCSELIADIYIKLGLIKNRKRHQFWPKDFQQSLFLEKDAYLSSVMQIQL